MIYKFVLFMRFKMILGNRGYLTQEHVVNIIVKDGKGSLKKENLPQGGF